jgi:hypothetical protein
MEILTKLIESKLHSNGLNWLRLMDLRFSPKTKSVAAEVFLEGEDKPLSLQAAYRVDGDFLEITQVETSKRWITEGLLLTLAKTGGKIALPGGLKGKMIRMLL